MTTVAEREAETERYSDTHRARETEEQRCDNRKESENNALGRQDYKPWNAGRKGQGSDSPWALPEGI